MSPHVPETLDHAAFPSSSFRYTPLRHLRVVFVRFLHGLFDAAPPGDYHWDPDDNVSEIYIGTDTTIDAEVVNKRPAVLVGRGPMQHYGIGIDDLSELDQKTGKTTRDALFPGTININVLSRVPIECDDLAWSIQEHIWMFRQLIMKQGLFDTGRSITISAPSPAGSIIASDGGQEVTLVTLSIPFQMSRRTAVTPLNQKVVNSVKVALSQGPVYVVRSSGPPLPAPELSVHECPPPAFASAATDVHARSPDPAQMNNTRPPPRQPHPMNPAKMVHVRRVFPNRGGQGHGLHSVPIADPCVEESE